MPHRPDIVYNLVSNIAVPKGLAIAVCRDRVMWVGPANILDALAMRGWPPGTILNLSAVDFGAIKAKLPAPEDNGMMMRGLGYEEREGDP
jgi:hypothetical protein